MTPRDPHAPGPPPGMTNADVDNRSELARYLRPAELPADAEKLRQTAQQEGAPDDILAELEGLPKGVAYDTVSAIWTALGHNVENRRT